MASSNNNDAPISPSLKPYMALGGGDDDDDDNNANDDDRYNPNSRRGGGGSSATAAATGPAVKVDRYGAVEEADVNAVIATNNSSTTTTTPYMLHQEPKQQEQKQVAAPSPAAPDQNSGTPENVEDEVEANRNTPSPRRQVVDLDDDDDSGDNDAAYDDDEEDDDDDDNFMSIQELLYSSSSYYAIAKPVTITMCLAALAVVVVNNDATLQAGEEAMSQAYQVWHVDGSSQSKSETLAFSLANAFIMISVIGCMTFVIVFLYKMRFMKCLIGYMILCSATLLGVLGGNLLQTAIHIYSIPVDKPSFVFFMFNFAIVGVLAVFFAQGIPMYVTQGYLVATAVVLAWQLSYFDAWSTWALLFMLALYDLCAVLTPCGPLKALVNAMSEEDAPEMPGLLFEAELPPEAKRPGSASSQKTKPPRNSSGTASGAAGGGSVASGTGSHSNVNLSTTGTGTSGYMAPSSSAATGTTTEPATPGTASTDPLAPLSPSSNQVVASQDGGQSGYSGIGDARSAGTTTLQGGDAVPTTGAAAAGVQQAPGGPEEKGPTINIPLAIAKVYSLPVVGLPKESKRIMFPKRSQVSAPLLQADHAAAEPTVALPENPTAAQLRANVTVQMPLHGGRLERVKKGARRVYLERDKHGNPKRILWVDRSGKVFAEVNDDDEDGGSERNSIRLGLGDFIFYSVLVAKAAQYSFATFAACTLAILAGLGGTLILLAVYHQALPALPISILLGIFAYLLTRVFVEPWVEAILWKPYYV